MKALAAFGVSAITFLAGGWVYLVYPRKVGQTAHSHRPPQRGTVEP